MLKNFVFDLSTRIEFGEGKVSEVGTIAKELGAKRVMLITDKGLSRTPMVNRVKESLTCEKIEVILYDEVRPNPRDTEAQKAAEAARAAKIDVVAACGGGSSMDLSKAVAVLLTNKGEIQSVMKPNKVKHQPAPLICIPTTAGTGSEVTSFAVLTIESESRKNSIFDDKIRPTVAINDPEVLREIPSAVAAPTAMDALTHAIEAYTCKLAAPITDAAALQAIRYIAENLLDFIYVRSEDSCRKIMAASLMAGVAFGFSDIAGVHCMAEALGGMYDTPHGIANSIFLPIVFEYNISSNAKRHKDVAAALGIDTVNKSDEEAAMEAVSWIAELCMKNVSLSSNSRELKKTDFINLYVKAYNM